MRWSDQSALLTERNHKMKMWLALPMVLLFTGCADMEIMREPGMSPVGTGLATDVRPTAAALFMPQGETHNQSLWNGSRSDLFSDQRATKIGDVITVMIAIDDKATFGNNTDRAMNSEIKGGINFTNQQSSSQTQWNPQIRSHLVVLDARSGIDRPLRKDQSFHCCGGDRCAAERQSGRQRLARSARQLRAARSECRRHHPAARHFS